MGSRPLQKRNENGSRNGRRRRPGTKSVLEASWGRFWSAFGFMLGSQIGPKTLPRASLNLMRCWVGFWVHFRRGPRQVGGAWGRGFRGVTCGNVGGFHRTCFDAPQFAALHGPLLSLNGSVAGSPVGLRPQNRPLSLWGFVDLAASGFERPFDQYFRTAFSTVPWIHGFAACFGLSCAQGVFLVLGGSWALLGGPWAPTSIFEQTLRFG